MFNEAGVLVSDGDAPLFWHAPTDRSAAYLPDSATLWDVIWKCRLRVKGFAHTHPGGGPPHPSHEDITTFSAIELALGRRLEWWIVTGQHIGEAMLATVRWTGPGKYDYSVDPTPVSAAAGWIGYLLWLSINTRTEGEER